MIKDIQKFKLDLTRFYEVVIPANHLEFQKKIALRLHQLIVTRNSDMPKHPVKTGWAVNNWDCRAYATFKRPPTKPIGKQPPEEGGQVLSARSVTSQVSAAKPYGIIWIYNNVPYISLFRYGVRCIK